MRKFQCNLCSNDFNRKYHLNRHLNTVHGVAVRWSRRKVASKALVPSVASVVSIGPNSIRSNTIGPSAMSATIREVASADTTKTTANSADTTATIANASAIAATIENLVETTAVSLDVKRKHFCPTCGLGFPTRSKLKAHDSVHVTPVFSCCSLLFSTKLELKSHIKEEFVSVLIDR